MADEFGPPSEQDVANALNYARCPSSGAQEKDFLKWILTLIAQAVNPAGAGLTATVKIDQDDPNNIVKLGGGVVKTPTADVKTADFTVPTGKQSVAFIFADDFVGTVLGAAVSGPSQPWVFNARNADTLSAIAMTRSAGSVTILVIP